MLTIRFKIWHRSDKENFFTVEMPTRLTFDHLMHVILDEFQWDDDHQYCIYCSYGGTTAKTKVKNSFGFSTSPMGDNERSSRHKLKCIDWASIKNVYINYDFGDNHWFDAKVIPCEENKHGGVIIVDKLAKGIEQYGNADDMN